MTKKEYKKARDAIIDYKGTRALLWIRLFMTLLTFFISLVISGIEAVDLYVKESAIMDHEVVMWIYVVAYLLIFEPLSFGTLGYCGAYSAMWVDGVMNNGGSWSEWLRLTNWQYSLASIGCFILGLIVLILLFKALKRTKMCAGAFAWFIFFLLVETVVCFLIWNIFKNPYKEISIDAMIIFSIHIINLVSLIMCCRSMYCVHYLNTHFGKGTSMKLRELKAMCRENQEFKSKNEENISIE